MLRWSVLGLVLLAGLGLQRVDAQDQQPPPQIKFAFPVEVLPPEKAPYISLIDQFTLPRQWPTPRPKLRLRRPSGYLPLPCRGKLSRRPEGAVLDCFLKHEPIIADAIVWEFTPQRYFKWEDWTESRKADLRRAFVAARQWRAAGYVVPWPGVFFVDPPANQDLPHLGRDEIRTVLSPADAWNRYVSNVAVSLAAEIDAWVPWSLRDYTGEMLSDMFDGSRLYVLDRDDGGPNDSVFPGGYVARGITQAHAATIYRFLLDESLIGRSPVETIGRVLTWSRDHMLHSFNLTLTDGSAVPERIVFETFWGYSGLTPVSEIIRGKVASHPELGTVYPGVHHWTFGCTSTTRFLRAVLAVVNIPVRELLSRRTCTHSMAFFPGEGQYLSHSDDPYSQAIQTSVFGGEDLLVPSRTWNKWFPVADEATSCRNVGRRVVDLNVMVPSEMLVNLHCGDLLAGAAHADSQVFAFTHGIYSVATLERRGFWTRLDAAAATSSSPACVAWRAALE